MQGLSNELSGQCGRGYLWTEGKADTMKTLIRIEELSLAAVSFYLFLALDIAWWWFLILLLAPDLSVLGYLFGPKVGAWTYNLDHHKGLASALFIVGSLAMLPALSVAGLVMLSHSSLDRALGYGLKHPDGFQNTHLGMIGRASAR